MTVTGVTHSGPSLTLQGAPGMGSGGRAGRAQAVTLGLSSDPQQEACGSCPTPTPPWTPLPLG